MYPNPIPNYFRTGISDSNSPYGFSFVYLDTPVLSLHLAQYMDQDLLPEEEVPPFYWIQDDPTDFFNWEDEPQSDPLTIQRDCFLVSKAFETDALGWWEETFCYRAAPPICKREKLSNGKYDTDSFLLL